MEMDMTTENSNYTGLLNKSLKIFFSTAWRITLKRPSQALFFFKTVRWQKRAANVRAAMEQEGVQVPLGLARLGGRLVGESNHGEPRADGIAQCPLEAPAAVLRP